MNENLCTFEGKFLKAVYCPEYSCRGCYLARKPVGVCSSLISEGMMPSCNGTSRKDGRDVVFVETNIDKIIDLD